MSKTQSVILREQGNAIFCSATLDGVGRSLMCSRLKDAISKYNQAKKCSCSEEETVSAAKNIGTASKKLTVIMIERKEKTSDIKYFYNEALRNFDDAYRLSSCKSNAWVDNLLAKFHETVQEMITYYSTNQEMEFSNMANELESFIPVIQHAVHLRCELCVELSNLRFNEGITLLGQQDFKGCLYLIRECHRPVEEARKFGCELEPILQEVRILEQDLFLHECVCRSHQARVQGDELLDKYLKDEESLNMGMVWTVVDLYKEAVILTRENDPEAEAIALSRLGSIFDKIIKDKFRAKPYMMRSIQMAMSLHPRTFGSESWFKDARQTLDRYQQEVVRQEDQVWNEERVQYVEELKEELQTMKDKQTEGKTVYLKYVYEKYPPRWKSAKVPDCFPDESCDMQEWKPLFKNAVIQYHPDKVDVEAEGKKWKVLCEEIFKILSSFYEMTK